MKTLTLTLALSAGLLAQPPFQVKTSGHGPAMILIPGLSCPGDVWDSTVARYQDRYQIHVLSIGGFAGVPRGPAPILEHVREGLAAYIREHHLDKPVIVGHSLGGFLALDLASKYPDLPGTLVIVDAYPFFGGIYDSSITPAQMKANAAMMRKGMEAQSQEDYIRYVKSGVSTRMMVTKDSDLDRIIAWGLASDRTAMTDTMCELFGTDLRDDLVKIKSRTLVLTTWAGYKQYTDREHVEAGARQQYAKLTGARIEMADTARHFIMWDDPDWMFGQLDRFLKAQ
jgi:pimeloyl-ACP methyl ester carboxylesterase